MEPNAKNLTFEKSFYVMDKSGDTWIRVSEHFNKLDDAQKELSRLRKMYPFARVGGTRRI